MTHAGSSADLALEQQQDSLPQKDSLCQTKKRGKISLFQAFLRCNMITTIAVTHDLHLCGGEETPLPLTEEPKPYDIHLLHV